MKIHFNHAEPADAPAETLSDVLTNYAGYSRFNPAVVKVTVVARDESDAEFVADQRTRIDKQVRAFDRYQRHGDLVIKRTYGPKSTAQSTWVVHPSTRATPHSRLTRQ